MSDNISTDLTDGVLTLKFNRPEKKNAITADMYQALADEVVASNSNREVRVILLTGEADSFTAGNDLNDFAENPPLDPNAPVFQFMAAISQADKPVVAAVNGLAIGIGTTVLMHCDLVYAVPEARFQVPFVNLALVPELASSLLLPQQVGFRKASEMFLLGEMYGAEAALEMGMINAIVEADQLQDFAMEKCKVLAAKPPTALRTTKKLLKSAGVQDRIREEAKLFGDALTSEELQEAVKAFFAKRPPDYSKFG